MLKRDVSLAEDLTGLRICAQELLSLKVIRIELDVVMVAKFEVS